jgi:hypothetical protein
MDRRGMCELMVDSNRLVEWLRGEASAQRERSRFQGLLLAVLASGLGVLHLVTGRGQAAAAALILGAVLLFVWVALLRRRVDDAARTLVTSLRKRPHEIRRISHVIFGRLPFRTHGVAIEGDGGGFLWLATRHWDVVLDGLAVRCRNARVEPRGSRLHWWR